MFYSDFMKEVVNNNLKSAYLFSGKEEYLMDKALDKLISTYIDPSFEAINYGKLEGKDSNLEDLIEACETLPFMSDKRVVVLKDVSAFMENIDKNKQDDLYKYLDDVGDFMCLILMDNEDSLRKNTKIYKYFKKSNKLVDFSKLEGRELNMWIDSLIRKNGKKMTAGDMSYLIQKTSYNSRNIEKSLFDLENEIMKLIDYSKSETITREDIDSVLVDNIDTNIFELLDSMTRFDINRALRTFNDMYMNNEPIQRIFYMVTRQVRLIYGYKLYNEKGYSPAMIQKKLKIGNYEFSKVRSQSSNFTKDRLFDIMNYLLDMDIKFKTTGSDEKLIMETFIVKMCS